MALAEASSKIGRIDDAVSRTIGQERAAFGGANLDGNNQSICSWGQSIQNKINQAAATCNGSNGSGGGGTNCPGGGATPGRHRVGSGAVTGSADHVEVRLTGPGGHTARPHLTADLVHARGASVVAITASQSPLARKADLALIVDHVEDSATHVPMISRILHLLMVDILVVGVTLRRGTDSLPVLGNDASVAMDEARPNLPAANRTGLGMSAAGALAHLTSHSK